MKNIIKIIMIVLSLCTVAGVIATGISVLSYAGYLDAGTRDPQKLLEPVLLYGGITLAFILLGIWLINILKHNESAL